MSKFRRLLLCPAQAVASIVLAVPLAAQIGVAPHFSDGSASRLTQQVMTEPQDQGTAQQQVPGKGSGDKQPVAAASDNASKNSSGSNTGTRDKKNKKKEAKPVHSDQEEEFERTLLGIYG
jgi:hypothetical protein